MPISTHHILANLEVMKNENQSQEHLIKEINNLRKQVSELKKSGEQLKSIFELSPDGIVTLDLKGIITSCNPSVYRLTGYTEKDILKKHFTKSPLLRKKDIPQYIKLFSSFLIGKIQNLYDFTWIHKNKSLRTGEVFISSLKTNNKISGFLFIMRDTTEHKNVEERLKILFEQAPDAYYLNNLKGTFIDGNLMAEKLTGYKREELLGKNFLKLNLLTLDQLPKAAKSLAKNLQGKGTGPDEFTLRQKNGTKIDAEISTVPVKIKGETLVLGIARDISERKKMEKKIADYSENLEHLVSKRTQELSQALQDSEGNRDKINAILKSISDGIIVTDRSNHIVLMNRAAEDLTGVHLSKAINQTIDFVIQDNQLKNKIKYMLEKENTGTSFDFELPGEDILLPRLIRARSSSFHDKDGNKIGIVTLMHDITYEREVDRMKTEFITAAAHELRTPLTSIRGFSEILMSGHHSSKEEQEKFLSYINQQSVNMTAFINDLFNIARIDTGKTFSLNKVQTDVVDYFRELISTFQDQNPSRKIKVILPKTAISVSIDQEKMKQVVNNLLSNAVKFSPNGGPISVKGETKNSLFELSIKDQGIGLSPENIKKVFDKFYKVDTSNTTLEGSGLGLNIAKHIIEAHGGKIWLESKINKGTTVTFTIPLWIPPSK